MNFPDLDFATAVEKELNPLSYNPDDYPTATEVIEGILMNQHKAPVHISAKELSVNGRVSSDKMERYLAAKYNSSSALKEVIRNPASYFFYVNDRANFECKPKDYFDLGTFCHSAFLEPDKFDKVVVEPEASRSSFDGINKLVNFWEKTIKGGYIYKKYADRKINQALALCDGAGFDVKKIDGARYYIDCLKEVSGYTAIKQQHKAVIDVIKRNYYRYGNGIIPMLLKGAQIEHSFYATDPETGLKVKVRPDAFNTVENIGVNAIISYKTTSAPDMGKFVYDSAKYKYELSEGMYQNVVSHVTGRQFNVTIMVVLQTVAPYLPAVFIWDPEDLVNGKYRYRYALDTIKECKDKGLYPGFDALAEAGHYGIIQMKQPDWATKLLQPVDISED